MIGAHCLPLHAHCRSKNIAQNVRSAKFSARTALTEETERAAAWTARTALTEPNGHCRVDCTDCDNCADCALTLGLRLLRATAWIALLALTERCRVACAVCSDCADRALTLGLRVPRGFQCCENRAICSLRILKRSMEKNPIGSRFRPRAPIFRILKALLQTITPLGAPVFSGIVCGY